MDCPWCEAELELVPDPQAEEQTCPECLTRWAYETTETRELVPAA